MSSIEVGSNHSGCLVNGEPFLFGLFGDSREHFYAMPRKVEFPEKVKEMKLGDLLSVFLTESGDVYTLGSCQEGQLGRKQKENKSLGKGWLISFFGLCHRPHHLRKQPRGGLQHQPQQTLLLGKQQKGANRNLQKGKYIQEAERIESGSSCDSLQSRSKGRLDGASDGLRSDEGGFGNGASAEGRHFGSHSRVGK